MTLRTRIALLASAAVALSVLAVAGGNYLTTRSELRGQVDDALRARAATMLYGRPEGHGGGLRGPLRDLGLRSPRVPFGGAGGVVQLLSADGARVGSPLPGDDAAIPVDADMRRVAAAGSGTALSDAHADGVHLRVLTVGVPGRGALQVARPLTEVDHVLERQIVVLALLGGIGILGAGGLGFAVARTALAPISRFTRRTEAVTHDPDPSHRLEVVGRDEITRLASSFNAMLDALERSVEAQRHLVADASHELRTPLASLRANVQLLQDGDRLPPSEREALRADIVDELDELTAIVSDVVELARGNRPAEALDDVRLDDVVRAAADRARRRAGGEVGFELDLEQALVTGEAERLGRAVANLLDNARKWSPPGGTVEVVLRGGELTVRDHGPGFDEADLPHVFERFYRASQARSKPGSGLGLAIVRQAVEAHGGSVAAANAPSGGATVTVRLPAEPL